MLLLYVRVRSVLSLSPLLLGSAAGLYCRKIAKRTVNQALRLDTATQSLHDLKDMKHLSIGYCTLHAVLMRLFQLAVLSNTFWYHKGSNEELSHSS